MELSSRKNDPGAGRPAAHFLRRHGLGDVKEISQAFRHEWEFGGWNCGQKSVYRVMIAGKWMSRRTEQLVDEQDTPPGCVFPWT